VTTKGKDVSMAIRGSDSSRIESERRLQVCSIKRLEFHTTHCLCSTKYEGLLYYKLILFESQGSNQNIMQRMKNGMDMIYEKRICENAEGRWLVGHVAPPGGVTSL